MSTDAFEALRSDAQFNQYAYMSTNLRENPHISNAVFLSQISTLSLEFSEAVIDISIPPGGIMVIDSNDFFVTLNNQNVIHYHSDAWLWLERLVYDVEIVPLSGEANLTKNILYDVKWI